MAGDARCGTRARHCLAAGRGRGCDRAAPAESEELLQDFTAPRKFIGRLPVLYDDGRGDVVYRVPRRFPAHARVVEKRRMEAARPIPVSNDDGRELAAYVEAVEHGPDRAVEMRWEGSDAIRLRASLGEGDACWCSRVTIRPGARTAAAGGRDSQGRGRLHAGGRPGGRAGGADGVRASVGERGGPWCIGTIGAAGPGAGRF